MGVHNLALSLLLLASFTLTSVVFFEISIHPPLIRQERELFLTFASDYQWNYDYDHDEQTLGIQYNLDFHHSSSSLTWAPSGSSGVASAQGTANGENSITTRLPYYFQPSGHGLQATQQSPLMSLKPPLWLSKLIPEVKNPAKMATDGHRATDVIRRSQLATESVRRGRPRGMLMLVNQTSHNSTNLARRVKYVNKRSAPVSRMRAPVRNSKLPQASHTAHNRYANRNLTSTLTRRKQVRRPSRPQRLGLNCTDPHCISYLLDIDYRSFTICQQWAEKKTKINHLNINATCKFMKGVNRLPVGLVSVPGSGNTWVRGLLETATGICTGSIYCDHPLRNGGIIGEYIKTGRVLVVKTHTSDYQWHQVIPEKRNNDDALYGSAILLIRNPFNAFIAEWNRLNALSTYSGRPIEPRKPMIRHNKTVSRRQSRKMPSIPLSNVKPIKTQQGYKQRIINKPPSPGKLPPSLLSKEKRRWNDSNRKNLNHQLNKMMQMNSETLDNEDQHGSVLPVGRKLPSMQTHKLKEDASHIIEFDKRLFGECVFNIVATMYS